MEALWSESNEEQMARRPRAQPREDIEMFRATDIARWQRLSLTTHQSDCHGSTESSLTTQARLSASAPHALSARQAGREGGSGNKLSKPTA